MIRYLSQFLLIFVLLGSVSAVRAQKARIAGLEQNEEYMELLRQQQALKAREDSAAQQITRDRQMFDQSANKAALGEEIVRLEGELFEIRNQIGKVTARVTAIEQEYIINHMDETSSSGGGGSVQSGEGVRSLLANSFFTSNLSKNDLTLFALTPRVEAEVVKIDGRIEDLYGQLERVKRQYDAAKDQDLIDSLLVRSGELKEQIEQVDALMERLWLQIYNRKLDRYLVLVDKIGTIDRLQLEQLDQESRQVRRAEGLAGEQLAPLVATYPLQKRLVLDYELTMARALGLSLAADSLAAEQKKFNAEEWSKQMTYPDVPFAPRSMVVYGEISRTDDAAQRNYTTVDDVPQLQVPKRGLYYTVQIALYTTQPKSIAAFKGVTPVMAQRLGNGQTRYVAGGFTTYAEAQAAATQMTRTGFRASVVAFSDGQQTTVAKAKALESAVTANPDGEARGGGYSVEITPAELRLPTALREMITQRAPGKTIVRRSSGNVVTYSVGAFATRAEADALAEVLGSQPNVKINVTAL